jgi:hypothetical protein
MIVENLQIFCSVLMLGATIESQMLDASVIEEYLHNIHQLSKLREYKDLVSSLDQLRKYPIKQFKLATASENIVSLVLRLKIVQE